MSGYNIAELQHEEWCDTKNNISSICNCMMGMAIEVIEELQEENKKLKEQLAEMRYHIPHIDKHVPDCRKDIEKLRECVEFYAEGNSHYDSKYEWEEKHFPEIGTETFPSGERARQCLKELGES